MSEARSERNRRAWDALYRDTRERVWGDRRGFLYRDRFFYRFLEPEEGRTLLEEAGFRVEVSEAHSWEEEAHPNYRDEPHLHTSRVLRARRPAPGPTPG